MAKPHGIDGEEKKFKRYGAMWSDVGKERISQRESASNLISIITKQSRGYWYWGRNIFPSNDHTGRKEVYKLPLSFCPSPPFSSSLTASLASFDIFELAWQWFFTARQSVPRPTAHTLINIRVSGARTARASPIVPPSALDLDKN